MEITWDKITQSEKGFSYKNIFHDYDLYVTDATLNEVELGNIIGSRYFMYELCIDEIMELFNEMTISNYSNNMTDFYSFVLFLFKKSFFNKKITREEAEYIYKTYIGAVTITKKYNTTQYSQENTEFTKELIKYKTTESDFVYKTLIKLLEELKYEW